MAVEEIGIAKVLGGGALFGTILAALGLRKMISVEVQTGIQPMKAEVAKLQKGVERAMTAESHKLICGMNTKNTLQRFVAMEKAMDLQIVGIKEHIDGKFDELTRRLDRRRATNGGCADD